MPVPYVQRETIELSSFPIRRLNLQSDICEWLTGVWTVAFRSTRNRVIPTAVSFQAQFLRQTNIAALAAIRKLRIATAWRRLWRCEVALWDTGDVSARCVPTTTLANTLLTVDVVVATLFPRFPWYAAVSCWCLGDSCCLCGRISGRSAFTETPRTVGDRVVPATI